MSGGKAGGMHGAATSEWTKILGPRDLGMKLSSTWCLVGKQSLERKHVELSRERMKSTFVPALSVYETRLSVVKSVDAG